MPVQPGPQPQGACPTCDAMWREFAHATAEYLKLQLDLYMATADRNWDREVWLNALLAEAHERREAVREVVHQHEAKEHGLVPDPYEEFQTD